MRWTVFALLVTSACASKPAPNAQPTPRTIDEFKTAVQHVLNETGVPGAGIALVRQSGVEWAGGVGLADRERGWPIRTQALRWLDTSWNS